MKMTTIGRGLRSALMIGVAFAWNAAYAADEKVEEIVVTGSRIPVTSLTSVSPLSVSSQEDIQMTNAFGLEDVLQKMVGPDTTGGTTNASNNGGVGVGQEVAHSVVRHAGQPTGARDGEQLAIGMLPGVAGIIMRGRALVNEPVAHGP